MINALLIIAVLGAEPEVLETARAQLAKHDDAAARKTLDRALKQFADQPDRLGETYLLIGLAWAESANEARARQAFTTAIKLNGKLELPPLASPKVIEWWVKAGGRAPPAPIVEKPIDAPVVDAPKRLEPPPPATLPEPPSVAQPAPSRFSRAWAIAPAGVAALAGVTGGVLLANADARYRQLMSGSFDLGQANALAAEGKALQTSGWALFGVSAVAVTVAIILAIAGQ